jgi:uncharacterized membrane protein YraQ (UPF0718 family)
MKDEMLFVLAVVLYAWAFAASPVNAIRALVVGWQTLVGVLPIIVAVFAALGLFNVWVDKKMIARVLGKDGGLKTVAMASLTGTVLVGPVYVIFPLLKAVREHGARWAVIGAVLTAWAVKVPMIPLEIGLLGWRFSVARVVFVALAALPIGYLLEWIMDGIGARGHANGEEQRP